MKYNAEALMVCNQCKLRFSVLIEGETPEEIDHKVSSDTVWFCPHCKTYDTYVDDVIIDTDELV